MISSPEIREQSDIIFEAWRHSKDRFPTVRKLSDVNLKDKQWREHKSIGCPVKLESDRLLIYH